MVVGDDIDIDEAPYPTCYCLPDFDQTRGRIIQFSDTPIKSSNLKSKEDYINYFNFMVFIIIFSIFILF